MHSVQIIKYETRFNQDSCGTNNTYKLYYNKDGQNIEKDDTGKLKEFKRALSTEVNDQVLDLLDSEDWTIGCKEVLDNINL